MTFFHFVNCASLAFGPHVVFYKATTLSENGTFGASVRAAIVFSVTLFIKLILWAALLKVSDEDSNDDAGPYDVYQELLKAATGIIDIAGLYYVLTQVPYRNISFTDKFQAVGLGWALADSLLQRAIPLWVGARGLEFTWDFLVQALESNASLVFTVSLAALGSLLWLRKNKPAAVIPLIYATAVLVILMPVIVSYVKRGLRWNDYQAVQFQLSAAAVIGFITWRIYISCQHPTSR